LTAGNHNTNEVFAVGLLQYSAGFSSCDFRAAGLNGSCSWLNSVRRLHGAITMLHHKVEKNYCSVVSNIPSLFQTMMFTL